MCQLKSVVTDQEDISFTRFFDSFEGAVSNFIQTELFIRQGERCKTLGVHPDLESYSLKYGEKLNKEGIDITEMSIEFLRKFKDTLKDEPVIDDSFKEVLEEYHIRLKENLVYVEIKPSDVKEIDDVVIETFKSLSTGNTGVNLISHLIGKLEELSHVRSQPGRGAETNIAVWKIVAIAITAGLGAWVVYKCKYSRWRCSSKEKKIYNTILALAMITYGACE